MDEVVITSVVRWEYFQWFLLGLYELQSAGKIRLKFKIPLFEKGNLMFDSRTVNRIYHCMRKRINKKYDSYNMTGYVKYKEGSIKKSFVLMLQILHFFLIPNSWIRQIVILKCSVRMI